MIRKVGSRVSLLLGMLKVRMVIMATFSLLLLLHPLVDDGCGGVMTYCVLIGIFGCDVGIEA